MEKKYNNNVHLLGKDIKSIHEILFSKENKLEEDWNIISHEISENLKIEAIYEKIKKSLSDNINKSQFSDDIFSFTIIYSLDHIANETENIRNFFKIIMDEKFNTFYLPFFIFLIKDENDKSEFNKLIEEFITIDKRNISCYISPLNEKDKEKNKELIKLKILKIFSYFFELGDNFIINNKEYKLYKETKEELFPINILLLGKTQVGKSTFINTLLKEKKAKEGGIGIKTTKRKISYHIDETPLIINDIEGFTGEETINKVIDIIKKMHGNLGENELNLVIYFIDYNNMYSTFFNNNEYLIFNQLTKKLDNTHFLFVCTKAKKDNDNEILEKIKTSFLKMINEGLKNKNEKETLINPLKYIYYCIKKDILYDEIYKEYKEEDEKLF